MAEFVDVIKKCKQICESKDICTGCPLFNTDCSFVTDTLEDKVTKLEDAIMSYKLPDGGL